MHIFAQCTIIPKKERNPKFSHSHISQSYWRNYRRYRFLNHTRHFVRIWFLTQLIESRIWSIIISLNYGRMICKTNVWNCFLFTLICVCILCKCSDTDIVMTSQRRCFVHDPQNHAEIFYNAPQPAMHRALRGRRHSKGTQIRAAYANRAADLTYIALNTLKMYEFGLRFHWGLFLGSKWQYSHIGSDNGQAPTRRQAIV